MTKMLSILLVSSGAVAAGWARHASAEFDKAGIKYVGSDSPGTAHEWLTWRRDLNEFAQLLFNK